MEFFTGLDETAICVVDDKDKVALKVTVVTNPDSIKAALKPYFGRLRLEYLPRPRVATTRGNRGASDLTWEQIR